MLMTRTELHRLVDALPEESLPAAAILLRRAQDPVAAKLDAVPYDDEELTAGELREVRKARNKPGISWSDAEAKVKGGLTRRSPDE
jgi:hypothetical protein